MKSNSFYKIAVPVVTVLLLCLLSVCRNSETAKVESYLNLSDTVGYVGMQTCRSCHEDVYQTFIKTGMGQSFFFATKEKSAADFNGEVVYDSVKNFYYRPFWKKDSLYVQEFRLEGKDTVYNRTEYISYVVGSGQHTNSHICNFNGYLYQAPVTFYTQRRKWDLAPGLEGGAHPRFERTIELECMTCHNGLPQFEKASLNKFHSVPTGIDCERCHGPGEAHVKLKLAGTLVDTAKQIDYSIVNPRHLSRDLQMSVCQRCHLQGLAVLLKGKNFDDFKPGMHLSEVMNVFLPETEESKEKFIMASQAERLVKSKCYVSSEMSCITCHNPHVSVTQTSMDLFNNKCNSCHGSNNTCTESMEVRRQNNSNCSGCHMPKSGSIDIPHVFITDHFIRVPDKGKILDSTEAENMKQYLRLKCYTDDHPSPQTMAEAYISFYERFSERAYLLDSAANYLFVKADTADPELLIHYYFLHKENMRLVAEGIKTRKEPFSDPWTYYRIGEANYTLGYYKPAYDFFSQACEKQPYNMDFQNKLAATLTQLQQYEEAKKVYQKILNEQPRFQSAWVSLGYLYMRDKDFSRAEAHFDKALALDPDYELALMNKAALYFITKKNIEAKKLVKKVLMMNPRNTQAIAMLEQLSQL